MQKQLTSIYKNGRPYMMAVVLGTALTTMPSAVVANEGNAHNETDASGDCRHESVLLDLLAQCPAADRFVDRLYSGGV